MKGMGINMMKKFMVFLVVSILFPMVLLYGCGRTVPVAGDAAEVETPKASADGSEKENELEYLTHGDVHLYADELADYADNSELNYVDETKQMVYLLSMPQIPESDDAYLYLFALECYEDEITLTSEPVAHDLKGTSCEISFPYKDEYLFELFVPALLVDGNYVPVSSGIYLMNPEALAENTEKYPEPDSKKGLLLDPTTLGTEELTDLGIKHAIYNIPLSVIMGETTNEDYPTIVYHYKDRDYYFNGASVNGYDGLFTYLAGMDLSVTAIVLNDWNDDYIEMIHPEARDKDKGAFYYMFNTADEEGVCALEAVACFLTERYSSGEHGMVHNWVIANEINQPEIWNYMDTKDVEYYAREFEKAFRIFYQAAKSSYAYTKIYFSIDHDWNSSNGNKDYFNGKDVVTAFNDMVLKHGNYDWGIAIHPYPDPLARVNFWSQEYDKTQDAEILSVMNLNVISDFLSQEAYLDTKGEVRSITITELGFSSMSGEKLQAAAFAYCYYIVDANQYIDAFILNRQTDAPAELLSGLAFGIYEYDHSEKYLKDIFRYIDTEQAEESIDFMLNILGAETLDEALSWAE